MNEHLPCSGVISTDEEGNFIERSACEVHLFDAGVCEWQQKVYDDREERLLERMRERKARS